MGKISDRIHELIERQLADRGLVVWYDPDRVYVSLAKTLTFDDARVRVLMGGDGFFRLREALEPCLEFVTTEAEATPDCGVPPKAVVYVPHARSETEFALIEAETAGVVLEPGAETADRNTRLEAIVERVFADVAPEKASQLARQAGEGLLTLADLDRIADEAGSVTEGALKLIFGPIAAGEVLLEFAAGDRHDGRIIEKKAEGEIAALAAQELGLGGADGEPLGGLRRALRRHLLLGEFVAGLPEAGRPGPLATFELTGKPLQQDAVRHVCRTWRNRVDLQEACEDAADEVEQAAGLSALDFAEESLRELETFGFIENRLLRAAVAGVIAGDAAGVLALIAQRRNSFWCRRRAQFPLLWSLVEAAAALVGMATEIRHALKKRTWNVRELVEAYARHSEPWLLLDRNARHLESRHARCELSAAHDEPGIDALMTHCRKSYVDALAALGEAYSSALVRAGFTVESFASQSHVYADHVRPRVDSGEKTAYLLVDALRFEMATELVAGLGDEVEVLMEPVIGQLPGITPVGMAALMPGAERGLALEKAAAGLAIQIQGRAVSTRATRMDWLKTQVGKTVLICKLNDIARLTPRRRKELGEAGFIVVTSQEIDRHGEEASDEEETRVYMDDVLEKLRRGIRNLLHSGVRHVIVAADHGFVFAEGLDLGLSMDPPGGATVDLHPRVWIGQGGKAAEGFFRVHASDLELGGPLELAFPRSLGFFKVKGGVGAYFHGGVSLQEHVLPVCVLKARKTRLGPSGQVRMELQLAKPRITNRLFSVTAELKSESLFAESPRRIRVEARSGKAEVGYAAVASYGYEEGTREILMQPGKANAITVMLTSGENLTRIGLRAVDCETQLVLVELSDIPVELAI